MNWQNEAQALIQQDKLQEAYDLLLGVRQDSPEFAPAFALQGDILVRTNQYADAMAHYQQAVNLAPNVANYQFAVAHCLAHLATEEADILAALRAYSRLFLKYPEVEAERASQQLLLDKLGLWVFSRFDEQNAEQRWINFPLDAYPALSDFHDYVNQTKTPQGEEKRLYSLRLYNDLIYRYPHDPDTGKAYANSAVLFQTLGLFDMAVRAYDYAFTRIDDYQPMLLTQRGMLHFLLGDMPKGYPFFEARWDKKEEGYINLPFDYPRWRGESLEGKRVLIVAEQGLGDGLQFVRYVPEMKKRGLDITVFNKPGVDRFLAAYLAQYDIPCLFPTREGWGEFDCFIPMMSLPYYQGITIDTIPYSAGYFHTPAPFLEKWQAKIQPTPKMKIGVVWGGSKSHQNNSARSIPIALFRHLFELDADFHCLQKEVDEADLAELQAVENLTFHYNELDDFCDTAGLVEQMDLIISVDTSVVHLAGGLGKPVWVMITYVPDFRWLLGRTDSVQYDSVRLFRQSEDRKWLPVIENVKTALAEKLAER